MSSHSYQCQTSLEHLPTEIILEVFTFLRLREIVTAFYGLNLRINLIIRSVRSASHVMRSNDVDTLRLLQLFPTQISHLLIVNVEIVDFTLLANLRSLTVKYGTTFQLDSICPQNFPLLEILHVKGLHRTVNDNEESINKLFQLVLSNGFPRLRICTALDIGALKFNNLWTGSSALRSLNLNITTVECEQLRAICPQLRRLTNYDSSIILNPEKGSCMHPCKRYCMESQKLEQLELENKFILDVNPLRYFSDKKSPSRFNGTTRTRQFHTKGTVIFQGRILPQSDPYCRASFLIEIALSPAYPFETPEIRFLDPIYHPNVDDTGCHYCCSDHILRGKPYRPRTLIGTTIESIIDVIDNIPDNLDYAVNGSVASEYKNDREKFYEKALKCTLSFGRSRD